MHVDKVKVFFGAKELEHRKGENTMQMRIIQYFIFAILVLFNFGFFNTVLAESTTVTSSGIKFPDGTTQTTAASGGGSSVWSQSGSNIYYSAGNVGIGIANPISKLHISQDTGLMTRLTATESGGETAIQFRQESEGMDAQIKWTQSSGVSRLGFFVDDSSGGHVADNERLTISETGNVGIDTTSPDEKLSVAGTIESTSGGIKFPDGTTQTTAATGGSSIWSQSGSNIYYNGGNVGIGTASPNSKLHISQDTGLMTRLTATESGGETAIQFRQESEGMDAQIKWTQSSGVSRLGFFVDDSSGGHVADNERLTVSETGNVGIGTSSPDYPLELASGAHVTTGGVWTDASSRDYKENIRDLTYDEAKLALSELTPSKFNYKADKDDEYLGFIAEDVPDLVATKDRKGLSPMDVVAVLTKVLQKQQEIVERQKEESQLQKSEIQRQKAKIDALERSLLSMNQ